MALSTDRGVSWDRLGVAPAESVFGLAVKPDDAGCLYAATTGGVYRTTDAGGSWSRLSDTRGMRAVAVVPGASDTVVAAGDSGAFLSTDAGMSWSPMIEGLENTRVRCLVSLETEGVELMAGTGGGAAFRWSFTTGVEERTERGIPGTEPGIPTVLALPALERLGGRLLDIQGRDVTGQKRLLSPGVYFVQDERNGGSSTKVILQK